MAHLFWMCVAVLVLAVSNACAEGLKERVGQLQLLGLHYGVNNLRVENRDILITRGAFVSEAAWGGDGYTIFVLEGSKWQMVRLEEGSAKDTTLWSVPHTEEDAVTALAFMVPKDSDAGVRGLYVLKTHRHYRENPSEAVPVEFTLYHLQRDDEFGIFYLRKMDMQISVARYCSADVAAYQEFGIPLPEGVQEHECP